MELSNFGAKVIYPPTILPVYKKEIPVLIKNTMHPEAPGTMITKTSSTAGKTHQGNFLDPGIALITIQGIGMVGVSGIAMRLFTALAREKSTSSSSPRPPLKIPSALPLRSPWLKRRKNPSGVSLKKRLRRN